MQNRFQKGALSVLLVVLAGIIVSGCYREELVIQDNMAQKVNRHHNADFERWNHHLLWGLVALRADVDAQKQCPSGTARFERRQNFWHGLVAALTAGLYTPSRAMLWCASKE